LKPDVLVLATGAVYRAPFHWLIPRLLDSRWARARGLVALLKKAPIKRVFYDVIRTPDDRLYRRLRASGMDVRRIGDCQRPGKTGEAMASAATLADRL
jgi:hypothetical protein